MPPKKRFKLTRVKGKRKGSPYVSKKQRDTLVEGQVSTSNALPENLPPKPRIKVRRRRKKTKIPPMVIEILKVDATPRHCGRPRRKVSTEPLEIEIPECTSASSTTGGSILNSQEPSIGKENGDFPSQKKGLEDLINVDWVISLQMGDSGCQELSKPVATSTMKISVRKDHDYCAAPDGKKAQDKNSSTTLQPENNIFDVVESEINVFTSAANNDESFVSADATGFIGPNPTLRSYPRSRCTFQNCVDEKKQLRSQIHDSIAAHYVSQTELGTAQRELDGAREQLAALRAQLEENAQALCSYLSAGGVNISVKTENQ